MLLINSDEDKKQFIRLYNNAKSQYKHSFVFREREIIVSYAYYTIEYLLLSKQIKGAFTKDKIFEYEKES